MEKIRTIMTEISEINDLPGDFKKFLNLEITPTYFLVKRRLSKNSIKAFVKILSEAYLRYNLQSLNNYSKILEDCAVNKDFIAIKYYLSFFPSIYQVLWKKSIYIYEFQEFVCN